MLLVDSLGSLPLPSRAQSRAACLRPQNGCALKSPHGLAPFGRSRGARLRFGDLFPIRPPDPTCLRQSARFQAFCRHFLSAPWKATMNSRRSDRVRGSFTSGHPSGCRQRPPSHSLSDPRLPAVALAPSGQRRIRLKRGATDLFTASFRFTSWPPSRPYGCAQSSAQGRFTARFQTNEGDGALRRIRLHSATGFSLRFTLPLRCAKSAATPDSLDSSGIRRCLGMPPLFCRHTQVSAYDQQTTSSTAAASRWVSAAPYRHFAS